jgi:hypothetical protein
MLKMSEICILMSVFIAFVTTGYLWFTGQKEEALFTATWIPSILTFVIYTEIISKRD